MSKIPRVLFSSVFKPFAEADNLYSRVDSKIEIFHNQLTKYQGVFSPRVHYSTLGLHAIANNLGVPSVVLDCPTLPRFIAEVKKGYDYVGIGSIIPNFEKVKRMCAEIRRHSPESKIIIGGFCATLEHLDRILDVDYICQGEGISFMRELLGLPAGYEFRMPDCAVQTAEILGVPYFRGEYRAVAIVGLGCPYGCDFCAPSHFFGRKHIKFLKTGQAVFRELTRLSARFKTDGISLMGDDNFLADEKRARELHAIVKQSGRTFKLYLFASADRVSDWRPEELAEMGVYNIWIGRESKFAPYAKNNNVNLRELIAGLHRVGINVILSSILLVDFHTQANIWEDVEDHLACNPDFSQFSFYSPSPGTPLYDRLQKEGRLLRSIAWEDCHAFKQPWFIHPEFSLAEAEKIQERAYLEDFHRLGPSLVRVLAADLEGYLNLRESKSPVLRARAERIARDFKTYRPVLKASAALAPTPEMAGRIRELLTRLEKASRKTSRFEDFEALGLYSFGQARKIRTRLFGDTLQPPTRLINYSG
jgi:radical SAM superfamily enzyme YgiQ (UPF0313 family)